MAGNNKKAFLAILTLTALLSCAPEYTIPSGETPELPEGAVLWLDLTRLNGASTKDTTEMKRMWDALHVSATLQGVVNRGAPLLYLDDVNAEGVNTDEYWWDRFSAPGQWLEGRQRVTLYDPVKACDLFALTSRFEGYPVTLIEARALQVPILAADMPCIREQITDNVNGMLTSCDPKEIADNIARFREDPTAGSKMREYMKGETIDFSADYSKIEALIKDARISR